MDADAEFDTPLWPHPRVALDHARLDLDGAAHGVDDAAELDESAVAGALDDAPTIRGDRRVDQVASQRSQPRENSFLVRAREPAVTGHVRGQDRGELSTLGHCPPPAGEGSIIRPATVCTCAASAGTSLERVTAPAGRLPRRWA
jgi:hypothetical protein